MLCCPATLLTPFPPPPRHSRHNIFHFPRPLSGNQLSTSSLRCHSRMSLSEDAERWMEFSHPSDAARNLMNEVASMIESHLGSQLNPSCTPQDVRSFQNADGTSKGSVVIRAGTQASKIDYILGSWLYCQLPFGVLSISTIMGMLSCITDAPHIVFEIIQPSPTSLTLLLDLVPRKDLVLQPDYLQRFYEDTKLDFHRQTIEKLAQASPYISSSLYIRSICSPTVISMNLNSQVKDSEGREESMEELIKNKMDPTVKEVFKIWFEGILQKGKRTEEDEQDSLTKRDNMIKEKAIEIDLTSNLPRLFGQDVSNRIVAAVRNRA
eukprot:TRINITY_DN413_c0_g1_i1.p1 TRINITY_DN413_c0_g1~~TRINITY_DN413_c0_g1_i1.p1  ORF type:complete len:322 (-),score=65.70 TRINITY_DN413_c0_g1_i1:194-1159(-)